jgi:hypothetical protein
VGHLGCFHNLAIVNSATILYNYLKQTKISFFKNEVQEGKTGPVWGLEPVGREKDIRKRLRKVNMLLMNMYSCMKMEQ